MAKSKLIINMEAWRVNGMEGLTASVSCGDIEENLGGVAKTAAQRREKTQQRRKRAQHRALRGVAAAAGQASKMVAGVYRGRQQPRQTSKNRAALGRAQMTYLRLSNMRSASLPYLAGG
jgi:sRNA-binding protein